MYPNIWDTFVRKIVVKANLVTLVSSHCYPNYTSRQQCSLSRARIRIVV